jgi:hypothetical protein
MPAQGAFDDFLAAAWDDHGDQPHAVAERIAASLHLAAMPSQVAPMARLATHVFGEHLGEWQRGIDVLGALRSVAALAGEAPAPDGAAERAAAVAAVDRAVATLRYAGGDAAVLDALGSDDRVFVLASAAGAQAGRGDVARAIDDFARALDLAANGLRDGAPAVRALAVNGNNLAAMLEEKHPRDARETTAMLRAAQAGVTWWPRAGTWLEEERAHYRLSRSRLAAGLADDAAASARQCLAVCGQNDAPAFERFFGYAALALAHHAAARPVERAAATREALDAYARVPADEQAWCAADLAALRACDPAAAGDPAP